MLTFGMGGWFRTLALCTVGCLVSFGHGDCRAANEITNRGLVAVAAEGGGVLLSWRLLAADPRGVGFDVYRRSGDRSAEKLNGQPIRDRTCFVDRHPVESGLVTYSVHRLSAEGDVGSVAEVMLQADAIASYLSIPIEIPDGYHANDACVADLDGDGVSEIVLHVAGRGQDNSRGGLTDPPIFQAYAFNGTRLWEIRLGINLREGAHYNPFVVADLDQDGRAELVCRTADGTIDGLGNVLGNPESDHRFLDAGTPATNRRHRVDGRYGKILSGPEYLTVFDGLTGEARDSVRYLPQRAPGSDDPDAVTQERIWGDDYGNRMDRFLASAAFLDGSRPSVVFSRGYYTRTVVAAWDFTDGRLQSRWVFDSDRLGPADASNRWRGQGNHSISVADLDQDGRDEIVFGSMAIDDDGSGLYSTGLGHGDAQHTGDLDPLRPGLETWSIHESNRPSSDFVGAEMRDALTGEILFTTVSGRDVARGMAADIDPRHAGAEVWGGSGRLYSSRGEVIGRCPRSTNMAIWWDGDLQRELLDGVRISKWRYREEREETLFDGRRLGLAANNGSKNNPCLVADVLGDWREELIARTSDNRELRIYVSGVPTKHRRVTLLEDRQYRLAIGWQNVGYNQPPHPSFDLATD